MARPTLTTHPKFAKLVARLRATPAPRAIARGALELLWEAGYAEGDARMGDAESVEAIAEWTGQPGALAGHLVATGFLDVDVHGNHTIHDLADHAPAYVARRMARAAERAEQGTTISEIRSRARRQQTESSDDKRNSFVTNVAPPAPAPAPEISPPARDPGATGMWTSQRWMEVFRAAWEKSNKGAFYGRGAGDSKALETLQASLEALPREARLDAERRAPAMLAEFLADESGKARKERWQFSYFVLLFNGLRVEKPKAPEQPVRCYWHGKGNRGPSRQPLDTCPECREERARNRGRTGEPTAPTFVLEQPREPATAEQLAELRAARKGSQPSPPATGPPADPTAAAGGAS